MDHHDFLQRRARSAPLERYRLERQWLLQLLERSEDPYDNHLLLVHSLGRVGWKIFRMHRQPQPLPWTREGMLSLLRQPLLQLSEGDFSLARVDEVLKVTQEGLLQRQLLTVLASDYRCEQQRDLSGLHSLRKSLAYNFITPEVLLGRLRDSFTLAGREDQLFSIYQGLEDDFGVKQNVARELSTWMLLVAQSVHRDFLCDRSPRNLSSYFWKAWPGRKKRDLIDQCSIEYLCDREKSFTRK